MDLKTLRKSFGLSQAAAATSVGMPLRTYIRYEKDESYGDPLKREMVSATLKAKHEISEERGVYSVAQIQHVVSEVLHQPKYGNEVAFCYLFGSYAKGYAKPNSDVDLCVSTSLTGLRFVGLAEALHQALHKKIDLIRLSDLSNNASLLIENMKDGVKIYG